MDLTEIIIHEIKKEGMIPFNAYMELCLYHPEFGYYTSERTKIGKNGDFYTSSSLGPAFGALVARQMEEMWEWMGCKPFTIVEYGAGTGRLAIDLLANLKANERMYEGLRYCIIEKSGSLQELEKTRLKEKVQWYNAIAEISEINGCILSNELLDNFAVHQVVMEKELMEVFVAYDNGFKEILKPAAAELKAYLNELQIILPEGFRTEINLEVISWIKEITAALVKGYVMTIDYGYLSTELCKSSRSQGTIRCYRNHAVSDCAYMHVGEQDITAHVNFSALMHWGEKYGLQNCGFTSQAEFLMAMGFNEWVYQAYTGEENVVQAAQKISMLKHTLLMDMGTKFKILFQEKRMDMKKLSGLT